MAYNLIDERWIPVERVSGKVELIAPAQVAEQDDPPLRIASPRPDFDGALFEFLVALLQTAAAPKNEPAWRRELEAPPSVKALKARLDPLRDAFFLDGDGPRFMQDLKVGKDPKASHEPIGALLIDRIGESSLGDRPSLFAKPGLFEAMSYPAAAAALMAFQSYAPAGGRGQLTSLRRGGPLTTLIAAESLWRTVWFNVLPRGEFEERVPGDKENDEPGAVFPWMAPTRKGSTPPQKVHPLQHLWGLPRRVRLQIGDELGTCSISGASGVPVLRAFVVRPEGTSYDGAYRHPWTPYSLAKPGQPWKPKKGSADGLPYRDWPLLVTGTAKRSPATVVAYFRERRRELLSQPRLMAFGYAMDEMKPLRWCRAETPLITVAPLVEEQFSSQVEALVVASEDVRGALSAQVRVAWSDRPGDLDVYARVSPAFWSRTEPAFFNAVEGVKSALESDSSTRRDEVCEAWLTTLYEGAVALFDGFVDLAPEIASPELRRMVLARRDLVRSTNPKNAKLRRLLELEAPEPQKPSR